LSLAALCPKLEISGHRIQNDIRHRAWPVIAFNAIFLMKAISSSAPINARKASERARLSRKEKSTP